MLKKINIKNRKLVSVISIILAILLTVGIASALILLKPKDYVEVDSSKFVVGKITDDGEFMSSDDYLCTKELIACDGLEIAPTFTASSKYQIFFYDKDYKYVYSSNVLSDKFEFLDSVPFVEYCRIMILPDRDNKSADEFKVTIFNKSKYVDEFEITVNKEQVIGAYKDYFEEDLSLQNMKVKADWDNDVVVFEEVENLGVSKKIDLSNVDSFYFITDTYISKDDTSFLCFFLNEKGYLKTYKYVKYYNRNTYGFYVYKVDCSEYSFAIFNYVLGAECHLYLDKGN